MKYKIGQKVVVTKGDNAAFGWTNDMNRTNGSAGVVFSFDPNNGGYDVDFPWGDSWRYSESLLSPLEENQVGLNKSALKIKKIHPDAITPTYATDGSACFDLYACGIGVEDCQAVYPEFSQLIRTGLAFEIPKGHVMMIYSRSGHGFKNDIRLSNCVGVIDSDYRGELMVKLCSDAVHLDDGMDVKDGDRIAQAMIIPVDRVEFEVVEELSDTERGDGGFGSTGV